MTLNEALHKYNLTLKEAFEQLPHKKNTVRRCREFYIIESDRGRFIIRKTINNKLRHFGSFSSLEDAVRVRDCFIRDGWDKSRLDEYCSECGVVRNVHRGRY